jgi:hypothetical protein
MLSAFLAVAAASIYINFIHIEALYGLCRYSHHHSHITPLSQLLPAQSQASRAATRRCKVSECP